MSDLNPELATSGVAVYRKVARLMVFPGRFSTGCRRCRQRKIKVSESENVKGTPNGA